MDLEELKKALVELEARIIDVELPKNYNQMTKAEQRAYNKHQNELKLMALMDLENFSAIRSRTKVSKPKNKGLNRKFVEQVGGRLRSIPIIRTELRYSYDDSVKERHKNNLKAIQDTINRFESTKVMRNNDIEFGTNFNNFIQTYLSKQACKTLNRLSNKYFLKKYKGYKDKNGETIKEDFKIQNLTQEQQKYLIKIRQKEFSKKLEFLKLIATKKVRNDNKEKPMTYMDKNGFIANQIRFQDATKKFTTTQSTIKSQGSIDMARIKNRKQKSELKFAGQMAAGSKFKNAQKRLIELKSQEELLNEFLKNYRGNSRQFSVDFKNNFPDLASKIYGRYDQMMGSNNENANYIIKNLNLETSPISVQEHEIMKQFNNEIKKVNSRMKYRSEFIPASDSVSSIYIGKILTNEKTKTEIELDNMKASEYEKAQKQLLSKKDLIGYETIFAGLKPTIREKFKAYLNNKNLNKIFDSYNDEKKKSELNKYLEDQIDLAKSTIRKNDLLMSSKDKLLKLNGVLVKKENKTSQETKDLLANLSSEDSVIYKELIQKVKEVKARYDLEKENMATLGQKLTDVLANKEDRDAFMKAEIIREEMSSTQIKISVIESALKDAEDRKKEFEKSFASAQIKQAISENKNISYNTSVSVFEKYNFPRINEDGNTYNIDGQTTEGKQIDRIVSNFVMKFKNQVQNMLKSFNGLSDSLFEYSTKLSNKLSDDFAVCVRDIKRVQKTLNEEHIVAIEQKRKNESLVNTIELYMQRFNNIENELLKKLKSMGVEISNVTLKR